MADEQMRRMEIKVGALILFAALLLVFAILLLGDYSCSESSYISVDFQTSSDLKVGAPVKISGVTVGKVNKVELWAGRRDAANGNKVVQVRVILKLKSESLPLIHEDAIFRISTLGILGEKYVEISPGTYEKPSATDGQVFDGAAAMNIDEVGQSAGVIIEQVSTLLAKNEQTIQDTIKGLGQLVDRADRVIEDNQEDVRELVANLKQLSASMNVAIGDGKQISETITSLKSLSGSIDRGLQPLVSRLPEIANNLDETLTEGKSFVGEARDALKKSEVPKLFEDIRGLTASLADGKGTLGALLKDREIYDDLIALMKDLKRHPWKLLLKD